MCLNIKTSKDALPIRDLTNHTSGTWTDTPPRKIRKVKIDSSNCRHGDLFVGLEGTNTHGQNFLDDAKRNGATAAIVEKAQESTLPQLIVEDSLETLQVLSYEFRRLKSDLYVIGITGSCGKTTVKEMIASLLESEYEIGKTPGNYNNHIGVPLTLLNQGRYEILVIELATNSPGEIGSLTELSKPDYGVITHIGPDHLEGFGSISQVALEKGSLFEGLPRDGLALLPDSVSKRDILLSKSSVRPSLLGKDSSNDFTVDWYENGKGSFIHFENQEYRVSFSGKALLKDASIAIAVAQDLGMDKDMIEAKLQDFELPEGRGRIIELEQCKLIDGGYNANPDSMDLALDRLQELPTPRLAVLGDMKELGQFSERAHRVLGDQLSGLDDTEIHYVGQYGDLVQEEYSGDSLSGYTQIDQLPEFNLSNYRSGLVKASHGVGLHKLVDDWIQSR